MEDFSGEEITVPLFVSKESMEGISSYDAFLLGFEAYLIVEILFDNEEGYEFEVSKENKNRTFQLAEYLDREVIVLEENENTVVMKVL